MALRFHRAFFVWLIAVVLLPACSLAADVWTGAEPPPAAPSAPPSPPASRSPEDAVPTATLERGSTVEPVPRASKPDVTAVLPDSRSLPAEPLPALSSAANNLGPLLQRLPELRRGQAPAWLQEGVRVTYSVATASIPRNRYYYYVNEHGTIIEADEVGPAGAGLVQFDLVALDRTNAVSAVTYFVGMENGVAIPWGFSRSVGTPGSGEYWIQPASLRSPPALAGEEATVTRMPLTLDGRQYRAVRIGYKTDDAEYTSVYDESTGLLLYYLQAVGSETTTHRQLTLMYFKHLRQLDLPWRSEQVPDWISTGSEMRYNGTVTTVVPGSPSLSLSYSIRSRVTRSRSKSTDFDTAHYTSGQLTGRTQQVTGVAQVSYGSWLPPEALIVLRGGQVLDRDPVTGVRVVVSRSSRTRQGDDAIVLTETGPSHRLVSSYDRNDGKLVAIDQETVTETATTRVQVQLTGIR